MGRKYGLRLFGAFALVRPNGDLVAIQGAKHKALLALLMVSANGTHTRRWLQESLWFRSGEEHGRASLRRALSDLRRSLGSDFDQLFQVSNSDITLVRERVETIGSRADGEFLEGLSIREAGFDRWLNEKRQGQTGFGMLRPKGQGPSIVPRVAIVPFLVVSGGSEDRFFSDMVCAEITRSLSRSNMVDVISHLSSREFSKPFLELSDVQKKLNIQYLVHGAMRIDGAKYNIQAEIVEAESGIISTARTYSGRVSDFLNGSAEIVAQIGRDIGQVILDASIELAAAAPLSSVSGHALLLSSIGMMHRHKLSDFSLARKQLEELVSRDPAHATLRAWLAKWYILSISQGWSVDPAKDLKIAQDNTAKALNDNPTCPLSLTIDGMVQGDRNGDIDLAEDRFRTAVDIDPNNALAWLMYSRLESFRGAGAAAVQFADRAHSLSPFDPYGYFFDILRAMARNVAGDYENGRRLATRSVKANPHHTSSYRVLAISQEMLGRSADAQATVVKLRQLEPSLTIRSYRANHPASMQDIGRQWADALQRAGVPEH